MPLLRSLSDYPGIERVAPAIVVGLASFDAEPTYWCHQVRGVQTELDLSESTLFDIASITKAFTATVVLRELSRAGKDRESRIVGPSELDAARRQVMPTVTEAIRYGGGFPPKIRLRDVPPYREDPLAGLRVQRGAVLLDFIDLAIAAPKTTTNVYNDAAYIFLGETQLGPDSSTVLDGIEGISASLGLKRTCFSPLNNFSLREIAATEADLWRPGRCHGVVHDENAYLLHGYSGHAGIFSTAADLMRFARSWAIAPDELGFSRADRDRALQPSGSSPFASGWRFLSEARLGDGVGLSRRAIGLSGFTGTSLWLDFRARLIAVVLTNRVFYGRDNFAIYDFRRWINEVLIGTRT